MALRATTIQIFNAIIDAATKSKFQRSRKISRQRVQVFIRGRRRNILGPYISRGRIRNLQLLWKVRAKCNHRIVVHVSCRRKQLLQPQQIIIIISLSRAGQICTQRLLAKAWRRVYRFRRKLISRLWIQNNKLQNNPERYLLRFIYIWIGHTKPTNRVRFVRNNSLS